MTSRNSSRINARLPPEVARKVAYLERHTKMSTTEVIRESIERYYAAVASEAGEPAQLLESAGFVGCVEGPVDLSSTYKEALTEIAGEEDVILTDTGFWLALANRSDTHHARARAALAKHRGPYVTTWPVLTETCHLLASRLGVDAELAFMRSATMGAFELFALDRAHLPRVEALMEKYRSLPIDLADASLVILAEESGSGNILSTDARDFGVYRWKNRKPFKNLL